MRLVQWAALCGLAACTPATLASPDGRALCAVQIDGGGALALGLADAAAAALAPSAAPLAASIAAAVKSDADAACAAAASPVP